MIRTLLLQNFRNYSKRKFGFAPGATLIVGPNAIGKTNILEAIQCLATGKSFRAEVEKEVIKDGSNFAKASVDDDSLEILWDNRERFQKIYKVNGVGRRQVDFVGNLRTVLFGPWDIEIVADSPSSRRRYLDSVLSLAHRDYRVAQSIYERALRSRNRLLWKVRELGSRSKLEFEYWDKLLIENGEVIHRRRKEFLDFLNDQKGEFFPVKLFFDHSVISAERLEHYFDESVAAAATLVGPHRDDFTVGKLRSFGSRGEQRMAIFTIKLGELEYVTKVTGERPVLLLDDIFSELDHTNRHRLLKVIPQQQTIMTTTDLHLVEKDYLKHVEVIQL